MDNSVKIIKKGSVKDEKQSLKVIVGHVQSELRDTKRRIHGHMQSLLAIEARWKEIEKRINAID